MVMIHAGKQWDISRGETVLHKGTVAYLKAIHAEIMPDTAEEVDETAVNEQGRFDPSPPKPASGEILRARPVTGKIDYADLSREHIARYPKVRARLAK